MAGQLIKDMTSPWKAQDYSDKFTDAVNELVRQKIKAGDTQTVAPLETALDAGPSNVIDLTELLANSLAKRKPQQNLTSETKAATAVPKKTPNKPAAGPVAKSEVKKRA